MTDSRKIKEGKKEKYNYFEGTGRNNKKLNYVLLLPNKGALNPVMKTCLVLINFKIKILETKFNKSLMKEQHLLFIFNRV